MNQGYLPLAYTPPKLHKHSPVNAGLFKTPRNSLVCLRLQQYVFPYLFSQALPTTINKFLTVLNCWSSGMMVIRLEERLA
jgi:hypothetical protein